MPPDEVPYPTESGPQDRVPKMTRVTSAVLIALMATQPVSAAPGDISLTKPTVACPQTQLDDESLQSEYDALWKAYSETVAAATKATEEELTRLYEAAKSAGNLDLALFWNAMKKSFAETGQLRWEPANQKKDWKRFGDAEFPEGLTVILSKCYAGFGKAKDSLEEGYKALEVALTKADKLEQALAMRTEFKGLWGSSLSPLPVPPKTDSSKASVNLLEGLDVESGRSRDCWKLVGKCLQCTSEGVDHASSFTFEHPQIERLAEKGEYDLAFQVTIKPPKDKFGSDVFVDLPGIPGSPRLGLRHYWKAKTPSQLMLFGGQATMVNGSQQPNINVPSPVILDGSKKVAVKVKVRRKGSAVTVLLNGRPVIDCNQFPDHPVSESLRAIATLGTVLTICDLTISEPEK